MILKAADGGLDVFAVLVRRRRIRGQIAARVETMAKRHDRRAGGARPKAPRLRGADAADLVGRATRLIGPEAERAGVTLAVNAAGLSYDGGLTWTAQSLVPGNLNAVASADKRTAWVFGDAGAILGTTTGGVGLQPVYRFYNGGLGVHFYTANEAEKNSVLATLAGTLKYEGVAYYVAQ